MRSSRHSPDRHPVDLGALTADLASMFRSTAERSGLRFDVDMPSEPVTATVDRAMWSTIVTNLLSNAVKYTERGGITVRLIAADGRAGAFETSSKVAVYKCGGVIEREGIELFEKLRCRR